MLQEYEFEMRSCQRAHAGHVWLCVAIADRGKHRVVHAAIRQDVDGIEIEVLRHLRLALDQPP